MSDVVPPAVANTSPNSSPVKRRRKRRVRKDKDRSKSASSNADDTAWSDGLTPEQLQQVNELLQWMASATDAVPVRTCSQISCDGSTAVMFLRGTKWRMAKAQTKLIKVAGLYEKLGDCSLERVAPFIGWGAQILPMFKTDKSGRQLFYVVPEYINVAHDEQTCDRARAAMYMYLCILEEREFQEKGVSVVLDLKGASFSMNRRAQQQTDEVTMALPCRFGGAYILSPPWWFSALFKVIKAISSSRLIERVQVLGDPALLQTYVDKQNILKRLGGDVEFDVREWLKQEFVDQDLQMPQWLIDGTAPPVPPPE
jgi:hypothetical protein